MITLEQIQRLDIKVKRAVDTIENLKKENSSLRDTLGQYEKRISELEILISRFKDDQQEIENKILHALSQLDRIEDEITAPNKADIEETRSPQPEAADSSVPGSISETDTDKDLEPPKENKSVELDIF